MLYIVLVPFKRTKEVYVVGKRLTFEARCGVHFEDVGSLLSFVPDNVNSTEVKTGYKDSSTCCVENFLRTSDVLTSVDKAVLVVANLPVNFVVWNVTVATLLLNSNNCRYFWIIVRAEPYVDTKLTLLLDVLGVQGGRNEFVSVVGDHNTTTAVAVKNGAADYRKILFRNIVRVSTPRWKYITTALLCQVVKESELVDHTSNVLRLVKVPELPLVERPHRKRRWSGVPPVNHYVIKTRTKAGTFKAELQTVEAVSKSTSTTAASLVGDYSKACHG
jgi:hypothetical protein